MLTLEAADAFAALRQALLDAPYARVEFDVVADSGRTADLAGGLALGPENQARLHAAGTFAGQPAAPEVRADGAQMVYGTGALTPPTPAPPALNDALVVGFFGMGVLHNLAMLTAGRPPDHADGGAAAWVTAHDLVWGAPEMRGGRALRPLTFDIRVEGQPSGTATLWLDAETGLPAERTQTVAFPGGAMEVVERYRGWQFDAPPEGFTLPPTAGASVPDTAEASASR